MFLSTLLNALLKSKKTAQTAFPLSKLDRAPQQFQAKLKWGNDSVKKQTEKYLELYF